MSDFTHLDKQGNVSMVDVSAKPIQQREAIARGEIRLQPETIKKIQTNEIAKGNVLATARLAGRSVVPATMSSPRMPTFLPGDVLASA